MGREADLIREYIAGIVGEAIRSRKGARRLTHRGRDLGTKFDMNTFTGLTDLRTMHLYARHFLQELGIGSSRITYLMSSGTVLKVARGAKGIAQNKSELASYNRMKALPGGEALVAEVYNIDESFRWLQSELVKELRSAAEFEEASGGYAFKDFMSDVQTLLRFERDVFSRLGNRSIKHEQLEEKLGELSGRPRELSDAAFDLLWATGSLVVNGQLVMADLEVLEHWGLTPDRRVVLLDYGYDREVYDAHYRRLEDDELDELSRALRREEPAEELAAGRSKNRFSVFWRGREFSRRGAYSNAATPEEALEVAGTAVEDADLSPVVDGVYEAPYRSGDASEIVVCDLRTPAGREAHARLVDLAADDSFSKALAGVVKDAGVGEPTRKVRGAPAVGSSRGPGGTERMTRRVT